MDEFNKFFKTILNNAKISISRELSIDEIRFIISKINEFFYTSHHEIGSTSALNKDFQYFSEFHKFWEKNHKKILNPKIDLEKCGLVADVLHDLFLRDKHKIFYELYDTNNLLPEEICKVRYFSANQDFRGSRDIYKLFIKYSEDPSIFDKENIFNNPEDFLKNIGVTKLSQNDKRVKFSKTAACLLVDKEIEPYDLLEICDNDILNVRNLLLNNTGSGFGNKKTDMFLRDMVVLGVWRDVKNFNKLDVASDINTVKVALRTGILKTDIPLLSSFLDIFCYQYTLIDEINALAWRKVWEKWMEKYPNECVDSPSLIDYLVYRIIGREFCKESLCYYNCEDGQHIFPWHSPRNKTCQTCYKQNKRKKASLIKKALPCSDDNGVIVISKNKYVATKDSPLFGISRCPFVDVCKPQNADFKKLNPPKSISILGATGWDSARAEINEGGGGLMS